MKKADLITGDFQENTMTFEIEGEMILKAGKYIIMTDEEYENLNFTHSSSQLFEKYNKDIVKIISLINFTEVSQTVFTSKEYLDARTVLENLRKDLCQSK